LVDQCLVGVDELVHDLHERRDCGGAFPVTVDDLVIPNANAGVAVLEELVGVVTKPLACLHGHPLEVEGVS
jgi:hypothetical protein